MTTFASGYFVLFFQSTLCASAGSDWFCLVERLYDENARTLLLLNDKNPTILNCI